MPKEKRQEAVNVLVLCDDRWHPCATARRGLEPAATGFRFHFLEDARRWPHAWKERYRTVLLAKANNISASNEQPWASPALERELADFVRGGGGLLAVHSGIAGYQETLTLRAVLGGVFREHPSQRPVSVEPRSGHPLTAGASAFTCEDEHYFVALEDERAEVFVVTRSDCGEQPGGWSRREGRGRVCVLTPGHTLEVWLQPSFQAMVVNALGWCTGRLLASTDSQTEGDMP